MEFPLAFISLSRLAVGIFGFLKTGSCWLQKNTEEASQCFVIWLKWYAWPVSELHSGYFHQFTTDGINLSRTLTRTYFPVIRLIADINQEVKHSNIAALLVQLCYTVVWVHVFINVTWIVPSGIKQKCSIRISLLFVITLHPICFKYISTIYKERINIFLMGI